MGERHGMDAFGGDSSGTAGAGRAPAGLGGGVPVLRTDRLDLTRHTPADLDALAAMWADPAVFGMIGGGRPRPREDVWLRLLRSVGQWALFGYGSWIARDRATGTLVGEVGLLESERAIDPPLDCAEVGWALAPAWHGRGVAGEAMAAALAWADAHGIARTCCIIDPANVRSIALAGRLGYVHARAARYHDAATLVLERPAA